jgi:hypothetical protein
VTRYLINLINISVLADDQGHQASGAWDVRGVDVGDEFIELKPKCILHISMLEYRLGALRGGCRMDDHQYTAEEAAISLQWYSAMAHELGHA